MGTKLKNKAKALGIFVFMVSLIAVACSENSQGRKRVYIIGDKTVQAEPIRRQRPQPQQPAGEGQQPVRQSEARDVPPPQIQPQAEGWGRMFSLSLDGGKVSTRVSGGRSNTRTYVPEAAWVRTVESLNAGDVIFIQFGQYEDLPVEGDRALRIGGSLPGLGDETQIYANERMERNDTIHTYGWYLRKMISDAKSEKAIPVVASAMPANIWENGKIKRDNPYAVWAKEVAEAEKVEFIDLYNLVADAYDNLGETRTSKLFVEGSDINMNSEGAYFVAEIVYNAAAKSKAMNKYVSAKYPTMEEMPEIEKIRNTRPSITPNLQQDASHIKKPYKVESNLPARQMEKLDRGVVALKEENESVFISWRLLGNDPSGIAFNVYRKAENENPVKLNETPVREVTWYVDGEYNADTRNEWFVRSVVNGVEQERSRSFVIDSGAPARNYISIPLQTLEGHTPGDASIADLDGDGEYEIILKQEVRPYDNSHSGVARGTTKLEAYKLDGTFMWRIDLGPNIREGAHYTQFMVYDFDGDGKAEVIVKTAEGTVDGEGNVITDENGEVNLYADPKSGYILSGPEYFSVFEGISGKELARENYIERGPKENWPKSWGDTYGNRIDRYLAGVGYFDGERPSVLLCRGYYGRAVLEAWNWRDGKLTKLWRFDTDESKANRAYRGQGNHNLSIADVDGDGKDEIIYGAAAIDHDGKGLYTTGLGHGDALHVTDHDPDRPGLEVFMPHESYPNTHGIEFRDARTGESIWGIPATFDVGRGLAVDIDPRYRGSEFWGAGMGGIYDVKGEKISDKTPSSINFAIWWDGDLQRELLDKNRVSKWDWERSYTDIIFVAEGCRSNNGSKSTPTISADIFGDWREEFILCTEDNQELRIFSTTIPTEHKFYTFMHDPVYRLGIAWQNVAYNQPPHVSFFLGDGEAAQPKANIYVK